MRHEQQQNGRSPIKPAYVAPVVELLVIEVEGGFANSGVNQNYGAPGDSFSENELNPGGGPL